jgi:hypothetical protein
MAKAIAKTTPPSADFLHKFSLVRPPAKYEEGALEKRFVILERSLSAAQKVTLAAQANSFTSFYIKDSQQQISTAVGFLQGGKRWIENFDDLFTQFPNFSQVYTNFNKASKDYDVKTFEIDVKDALSRFNATYTTIKSYVNEAKNAFFDRKILLWDNMLTYYLNPDIHPEVREEIMRLIRMYWVMEKFVATNLVDNNIVDLVKPTVSEAMQSTIVLPQKDRAAQANNLPAANNPPANPPTETPEERRKKEQEKKREEEQKRKKEIDDRYNSLKSAVQEINTETENQAIRYKSEENCNTSKDKPAPDMLQRRHVDNLSGTTHALLKELKVPTDSFHVPTAIARLKSALKEMQPASTLTAVRVMKVGNAIMGLNDMSVGSKMNAGSAGLYNKVFGGGSSIAPSDPFTAGVATTEQMGQGFKVGIAPLFVVQTKLLKYEKGEIAHIENILAGESKKRNLRVLNRIEDILTTDEETTKLTEKDSQTTDKFELSQEINKNQKEEMKFDTGLKVNADLGTVKIAASADFAYSNSKDTTEKTAVGQSKEIINKAVNQITERTRTQHTIRTVKETEEINDHTLANATANHVSGIYRWVDKFYLAQVKSYGSRKMLEFVVPEPAAFYLFSKANKRSEGNTVDKPIYPQIWAPYDAPETTDDYGYRNLFSYKDIKLDDEDPSNSYMDRVKQNYGNALPVQPKSNFRYIKAITTAVPSEGSKEETKTAVGTADLTIPPDYYVNSMSLTCSYDSSDADPQTMKYVAIGDMKMDLDEFSNSSTLYNVDNFRGEGWVGNIPVSYHLHVKEFVIEVECLCSLTKEAKDRSRKAIFDAIMLEYNNRLKDYNQWLKEKEDEAKMEIVISGNNPDRNREIEKEELKRASIEILTSQRFESFDAMRYPPTVPSSTPYYGYPDFSFTDVTEEGRYIEFFEQIFDWHLMTYEFYPYFWGNKGRWTLLKSLDDNDPIFRNFLQAGAARVIVPVKKNYDAFVDYFIQSSGKIWNGGEAPNPGDPYWLSVADDMKNDTDNSAGEVVDEWIIKLPTDLVILDDVGSGLPNNVDTLDKLNELFPDVKKELGI